jgi:electron transfer flavoprotein alpha/beta subunit
VEWTHELSLAVRRVADDSIEVPDAATPAVVPQYGHVAYPREAEMPEFAEN